MNSRRDFKVTLLALIQTVGAAFLLARKWQRFQRRHDTYEWDRARFDGRWLQPPSPEWKGKSGHHIAFYADGFAESRMALQLGHMLSKVRPDWKFSLVVRNLQDARDGHAIPESVALSALPFDYFPCVKRWVDTVKPDAVVMIEKLWYPNFVRGCAYLGVPVVGVNSYTRASDTRKYPAFKRWILGGFSALGLRSQEQQGLLEPLLDSKTKVVLTGTLKFLPPIDNPNENKDLRTWLCHVGNRPLIAAGSIETGEEATISEAFKLLRQETDATLLWAPRHIESGEALTARLRSQGWEVSQRSEKNVAVSPPDILLLDTMGELMDAYAHCAVAFVGGTFSGGGHNVLEPLAHGVPVVFGPNKGFFAAEQRLCEENDVGFAVKNSRELADAWKRVLTDREHRRETQERIAGFVETGQKSWAETIQLLLDEFDQLGSGKSS